MMEHFSIKAILSVTTLITALTLVGCNQTLQENGYSEHTTEFEQSTLTATNHTDIESITLQDPQDLSSGNMLNIARDIAKLQLETDDYAANHKIVLSKQFKIKILINYNMLRVI